MMDLMSLFAGNHTLPTLLLTGVLLLIIAGGCRAEEAGQVVLTLRETAGVDRNAEAVTGGIPLPKGAVSDISHLRLIREEDGKEVPAQFRVAGQWWPDPGVRWVLVDLQADLPAGAIALYRLEYGPGVKAAAVPSHPLKVTEDGYQWTIDTGAARFAISKTRFSLFEEVTLAGGARVVAPGHQGGARLRDIGKTVTRAIPGPENRGDAHLIHVEAGEDAPAEDWTLTFIDDEGRFEVAGSRTGPDGSGVARWGEMFRSKSGRILLGDTAWLVGRQAKKGDRFTFAVVPEGAEVSEGRVTGARWLEKGPLRCALEVKGSPDQGGAPVLEFTARYHFYAGSGQVKISLTLENNNHSGRTETGNFRNADIGTPGTVFFNDMSLSLPLKLTGPLSYTIRGDVGSKPLRGDLKSGVCLYQDSSGTNHWDRYRDPQYHPRPNSFVTFRGYRVMQGEKQAGEGRQAVGWLDVSGSQGGLGATVRDFWQNFPKALTATPEGQVEIGLFPGQYSSRHPLRPGEHKTHDILFDFHPGGRSDADGTALARAFSDPLVLEPSPEWWAKTGALGLLHPYDPKNYPAYEIRNLSTIGIFGEGVKPGPSLLSRIEECDFYGWMDYGDVPIDFEAPSGQWNLKYDFDYFMLRQYARTGQRGWLKLFRAAARHMGDIDVFHAPHYPELFFQKGGVYAHSLHNEPGHMNPHRNYNHFTRDLSFGARGTAALYYTTGDWKAYESCLEIAGNALAPYMSPQQEPPDREFTPPGDRGAANTLNRLLEGYQLTGEMKYLDRIRWCIKESAFDGRVSPEKPVRTDIWSMTFYALALVRYIGLFPQDALAQRSFRAYADLLVKSVDPAGDKGACYTITLHSDGRVERQGTCSHYNIMISDALAHAFRLTGDRKYLQAADLIFPYGVKNACWEGGPPTYTQVHSAAGSTCGDAYMAVQEQERR